MFILEKRVMLRNSLCLFDSTFIINSSTYLIAAHIQFLVQRSTDEAQAQIMHARIYGIEIFIVISILAIWQHHYNSDPSIDMRFSEAYLSLSMRRICFR